METTRYSVAQRLAIEKQLLMEEKYIVNALKVIKEERFALQREGTDLLCRLKDLLRQGEPSTKDSDGQEQTIEAPAESSLVPTTSNNSFLSEFQVSGLDELVNNEVELNLTVPTHNFYDQMPEEEFEEIEADDDFELEMSMLMQMQSGEKSN